MNGDSIDKYKIHQKKPKSFIHSFVHTLTLLYTESLSHSHCISNPPSPFEESEESEESESESTSSIILSVVRTGGGGGGGESAIPISPAVQSHALRRGEMGDSLFSSVVEVVAMLKLNGMILGTGGCARRGDLGGGVGDVGEEGSSLEIQSVMLTSGSSGGSSAVVEASEREELGEGGRERSRTGRWRERGFSFGGYCVVGLEGEGGMYPGVEVKLDSSSSVERRVVICDVRFSAALTRRLKILGTEERVTSGAEEVVLVDGLA